MAPLVTVWCNLLCSAVCCVCISGCLFYILFIGCVLSCQFYNKIELNWKKSGGMVCEIQALCSFNLIYNHSIPPCPIFYILILNDKCTFFNVNRYLNRDSDWKITSLIFKSPDLNPLDGLSCGMRYWDAIYTKANQQWAEDCLAIDMEWIASESFEDSTIRQSCHFERVCDSVLLQLADTYNTQFKYRGSSWHSLLKRLKCLRRSCTKFDSLLSKTYWIFRTWLHGHLKMWTLTFTLLYLLNHMCYFNKICRICGFC